MADFRIVTLTGTVVEDHVEFTLPDLCRASGADSVQLSALVDEGLLQPRGDSPAQWRFSGHALPQARTALRLARELDIGLAGAAVAMALLAEIDTLRSRLRRLGDG